MSQVKLTSQQEAFVLALIQDGMTQSDAYRAAYKAGKMTPKQVHEEASRLASNPKVATRLAELRKEIEQRGVATAAQVLREASRIALFDPRKLLNDDGTPRRIKDLDDDSAAAIAGLKVKTLNGPDGETLEARIAEYKIADKNAALEKLFKFHGLYKEDNKQQGEASAEALRAMSAADAYLLLVHAHESS